MPHEGRRAGIRALENQRGSRRFRYHKLDWSFGLILRMAISWSRGLALCRPGKPGA
jgi:hypothetical protein